MGGFWLKSVVLKMVKTIQSHEYLLLSFNFPYQSGGNTVTINVFIHSTIKTWNIKQNEIYTTQMS